MRLTDTHCHLDLNKFDPDRHLVIENAHQAQITRILIPGLTVESSRSAVALAQANSNIFAAIGVHPNDAQTWNKSSLEELHALYINQQAKNKIAAIGEIGLDYYWNAAPAALQKEILKEQLDLAQELCLPVVLHLREQNDVLDGECARDMLQILEQWIEKLRKSQSPLVDRPGVLHSFSGSLETAQKVIELNFYIGITGPVTYKNADVRRTTVRNLPLEKLLIETDSPFLAPVPHRGKRNEPAFVRHIADKIAEIHERNPEEIAEQTTQNAEHLFAWGG